MARRLTRAQIAELYSRLAAAIPAPQTELEFANPFTLLVAVILSAQATDASVNKATPPLFAVANTPEKMAALSEERLGRYIKTIGLWRGKAKNIVAMSKLLIERHGGEVPRDRAALESLPGVGRKTANVVLNTAFGESTIAVDTHVFRVANRTGLAPGATPLAVEDGLVRVTPAEYARHAHHWLILHGRYVCLARKPKCPECVVRDICLYRDKTQPAPAAGIALHSGRAARKTAPSGSAIASPPPPLRGAGLSHMSKELSEEVVVPAGHGAARFARSDPRLKAAPVRTRTTSSSLPQTRLRKKGEDARCAERREIKGPRQISGLRTLSAGKREKSRSADHSSLTPWSSSLLKNLYGVDES